MSRNKKELSCLVVVLSITTCFCSRPAASNVKKMPEGKEFSGYLSDYAKLQPNPRFETAASYISEDPAKNIHKYVAMIVEPPAVYVSTGVDESAIPERGRAALAEYFQNAITNAVSDAFPVVQSSGPLVLRLRSAIVGVDVGPPIPADQKEEPSLERAINIGKVVVEMELVDSETGEQIAAVVDRQNLGAGAMIASAAFSREDKFRAATQAFDGWAKRLRDFLDSAHELSKDDVARVEGSNFPYTYESAPK